MAAQKPGGQSRSHSPRPGRLLSRLRRFGRDRLHRGTPGASARRSRNRGLEARRSPGAPFQDLADRFRDPLPRAFRRCVGSQGSPPARNDPGPLGNVFRGGGGDPRGHAEEGCALIGTAQVSDPVDRSFPGPRRRCPGPCHRSRPRTRGVRGGRGEPGVGRNGSLARWSRGRSLRNGLGEHHPARHASGRSGRALAAGRGRRPEASLRDRRIPFRGGVRGSRRSRRRSLTCFLGSGGRTWRRRKAVRRPCLPGSICSAPNGRHSLAAGGRSWASPAPWPCRIRQTP
jgi:hypothetical protein